MDIKFSPVGYIYAGAAAAIVSSVTSEGPSYPPVEIIIIIIVGGRVRKGVREEREGESRVQRLPPFAHEVLQPL